MFKTIKIGTHNSNVEIIQKMFNLECTGIFDNLTSAAIKNFQNNNELYPSGELDIDTYYKLFNIKDYNMTTDNSESNIITDEISIQKFLLSKNEYVVEKTDKKSIFIHHTAGWENPFNQVNIWEKDNIGRIGTHFVVGGINPVTGDNRHDGTILQCIPDENWAYHLGVSKFNSKLDKESFGIELCNFGYLTEKNGEYFTYTKAKVRKDAVCKLDKKFRGYEYWHNYSDKQIESLKYLILYISKKFNINIKNGLCQYLKDEDDFKSFEYKQNVLEGKVNGLFSHTTVRKDKFDCYPHPKLVKMLGTL